MNILEKGKIIGKVFKMGMMDQINEEWTWGASTMLGLNQGLKYKGSLKNGLIAGVGCLTGIAAVNGVRTVIKNWSNIKQQF